MAQESIVVAGERIAALFLEEFDVAPVVVASAAARVNLIGEHTDYNGGEVLPIAIARRTYVAVGPSHEATSRAVSATQRSHGTFDAARPERADGWWDYVAGVVSEMRGA